MTGLLSLDLDEAISVDEIQDINHFIAYQVAEGFDTVHDIIENATAYAQEKYGRNIKTEIRKLTAERLVEHKWQEASWDGQTDCDRLDQALDELNKIDIVARQNFSCCNNCGHREIWDEIEVVEKSRTVKGYVFYHFQCIEEAIKSGRLLMAYGSVEEDEQCLQEVANTVVGKLQTAGLKAEWSGDQDSPIIVNDLVWLRRRTHKPASPVLG
jgi:hypothetical protein